MAITEESGVSHIQEIVSASRCPSCHKEALYIELSTVSCHYCGHHYNVKSHTVNFIDSKQSCYHSDFIKRRALKIWGESLHSDIKGDFPTKWHNSSFHRIFSNGFLSGNIILEIGCGVGFDAVLTARKYPGKVYYALDIGENVIAISERDRKLCNLHYVRGDCLNLPVKDSYCDAILSYGVFHHTNDPLKCMQEAFRALKLNGSMYVYLYKNHEHNPLKYFGVMLERIIMSITSKISIKTGKLICLLMSPLVLVLFSWPAQLLKRFKRLEKFGYSFPLHWGSTPVSIMPDLQDRLLSPVNHRFSKKNFLRLFLDAGFSDVQIITNNTGHFGYAIKKKSFS
jgi:SAM-dependent methyltransferase